MRNKKLYIFLLVVFTVVAIVGGAGYFYIRTLDKSSSGTGQQPAAVKEVVPQVTNESKVVPSTQEPTITKSPVPVGLHGPSGLPTTP